MQKTVKTLGIAVLLAGLLALFVMPAAAQENTSYPVDTIKVIGAGSASGSPDMANINIGVRTSDPDVSTVFERNNATVDDVIEAMVAQGVAREDIRTVNIYLYQNENYDPASSGMSGEGGNIRYELNNELRVTVRDTDNVSGVISAAVEAGANNIFNLSFGFSDQSELEDTALERAMDDARTQAGRIAELSGVELGEIIVVNENSNAFVPGPYESADFGLGGGGGGNMPVEPGELSVNVQIEVTFRITR